MSLFAWIGTCLGLAVGLVHAAGLFKKRMVYGESASALYYAVWTVGLWTLFGAYVLGFWVLGLAGLLIAGLLGVGRRTR